MHLAMVNFVKQMTINSKNTKSTYMEILNTINSNSITLEYTSYQQECVTYHKAQSHEVQIAKEHVIYLMTVCVFGYTTCMIMLYMIV